MGAAEIGARASGWALNAYERLSPTHGAPDRDASLGDVWLPAGISGGRFFESMQRPGALREALLAGFPHECSSTIGHADELVRHRITLFSTSYDLGPRIDWQRDPRSSWPWPSLYYRDVLAASVPPGVDVKHVWELNRHQFLVELATAWLLSKRPDYRDRVWDTVQDWVVQNPFGRGVNWAGPLEVAYRALSWLWAAHLVDAGVDENDPLRRIWALGLYEHAVFLDRHLELYSSPYNHLIGEAAVLFILGLVFPHWPNAPRWRDRGRKVLERRLPAQFYSDGGSVEQAIGYHHATLGYYLLAGLVARRNQQDLSPAVWHAIERAMEWSMWTIQPDGSHPALGDNDDARPFRFSATATWDFRSFLSLGAVLFGRGDFKAIGGRWHQEGEWLLDPGARERFDALPSARPSRNSIALAPSGYVVMRSTWSEDADYICFDVGEIAGGLRTDDVPSAGHGHADCLAVVVAYAGTPLLIDAGFFTYNSSDDWEQLFRATELHNTVRVDGRSQGRYFGKMTWSQVPRVELEGAGLDAGPGVMWARGSHDGYARGPAGVQHTRTVMLRPGAYVAIFDQLTGQGEHAFEVGYLLSPQAAAERRGAQFSIGGVTVALAASCPLEVT